MDTQLLRGQDSWFTQSACDSWIWMFDTKKEPSTTEPQFLSTRAGWYTPKSISWVVHLNNNKWTLTIPRLLKNKRLFYVRVWRLFPDQLNPRFNIWIILHFLPCFSSAITNSSAWKVAIGCAKSHWKSLKSLLHLHNAHVIILDTAGE